jgi:hypothetical protein
MDRTCSTKEEKRNPYRILVRMPEGNRTQGRPLRRWVDNIEMNLRERGWNGMLRNWQLLKKGSAP